jgi:hypothetical protein
MSYATVTWQVEHTSSDLHNEFRNKIKEYENFCLAPDEHNNTSDTAALLIIIWSITESYEVVEELASVKSLQQ